jgi:competence protein ComFC
VAGIKEQYRVQRFKDSMPSWLGALNHILWPTICLNCRKGLAGQQTGLCSDCWDELLECSGGYYCRRCGSESGGYAEVGGVCPVCQGQEIIFDQIARAGIYQDVLRDIILALKNGRTELDKFLGEIVDAALKGSPFADEIDLFVPVPLHWMRKFSRGYNQSHLIAKKLKLDKKKINTELVRVRRTQSQPFMATAAARKKNVAGAFAVRKGHGFQDKRVCLVDDIKTTGATLNECAKVLKEAGTDKVYALVIAVAGQK